MMVKSLQIGYMAAVFSIQMVSAILSTINADIGGYSYMILMYILY